MLGRKKKWLISMGITGIIIVFGGYAGINAISSYVLNSLTVPANRSSPIPPGPPPAGNSAKAKTYTPSAGQAAAAQEQTAGASAPRDTSKAPITGVTAIHSEAANAAAGADASSPKQSAAPEAQTTDRGAASAAADSQASPAADDTRVSGSFKYEPQVSSDKAKAVQESITLKEKAELTSILLKKLSASDIQLFIKMARDGMSVDEKKEAKKIILKKLTEDEYNELISIAAKYGLSQGKNYAQSKQENLGK